MGHHSHDQDSDIPPQRGPSTVEARLADLEAAVAGFGHEVRSRRLVVIDEHGRERMVAEVRGGQAELRVQLPVGPAAVGGAATTSGDSVVFFACPAGLFDAGVGLQLWGGGETLGELAAWEEGGVWRIALHIDTRMGENATGQSVD
jgi:hypothetical protein